MTPFPTETLFVVTVRVWPSGAIEAKKPWPSERVFFKSWAAFLRTYNGRDFLRIRRAI